MNLQELLNGVIAEAIQDKQELVPTDELPSGKIIAARIEELEKALQDMLSWYSSSGDMHDIDILNAARKALAQS